MSFLSRLFGKPKHSYKESDWVRFAAVPVSSGKMWIGDAGFAPNESDGLVLEVPPGTYEVFVKRARFSWGESLNTRMRARLVGTQPTLGEAVGETWSDMATQSVCDFDLYREAVGGDWDAYWEQAEEHVMIEGEHGSYQPQKGTVLAFCTSGRGDGTFPVVALKDGDRLCGVEIEFLNPEDEIA